MCLQRAPYTVQRAPYTLQRAPYTHVPAACSIRGGGGEHPSCWSEEAAAPAGCTCTAAYRCCGRQQACSSRWREGGACCGHACAILVIQAVLWLLGRLTFGKQLCLCLGLARTVYIHRIWPYIWGFPCQKYRRYTVYIWFWPTLLMLVACTIKLASSRYFCESLIVYCPFICVLPVMHVT